MHTQVLQHRRRDTSSSCILLLALIGVLLLSACTSSSPNKQSSSIPPASPTETSISVSATLTPPPLSMGLGWQDLLTAHNTTSNTLGATIQETIGMITAKKTFTVLGWCQGTGKMRIEVVSRGTSTVPCNATPQPITNQFTQEQNPSQGTQYEVRLELEGQTNWALAIETTKES